MAIGMERSAGLVTITLDRPAKKNAIDSQTWIDESRASAGAERKDPFPPGDEGRDRTCCEFAGKRR
jgi:enoyl-CoA hydratase/carnithine racemase